MKETVKGFVVVNAVGAPYVWSFRTTEALCVRAFNGAMGANTFSISTHRYYTASATLVVDHQPSRDHK